MPSIPALQSQLGRSVFQLAVLAVLVVTLLAVRSARRAGHRRTAQLIAGGAASVALAGVLGLTLLPAGSSGPSVRTLHLDPIEGAWGWDSIAWNPVIDNVALFVPLAALAVAVWWRRSPLAVWLGCVVLSAGIETAQFLLPIGRVANAADLLANATGAVIGVAIAVAVGVRRVPPSAARRDRGSMTHAA